MRKRWPRSCRWRAPTSATACASCRTGIWCVSCISSVFYDASCPICATEMHALRDRDCNRRLELVDCSAPEFDDAGLLAAGVSREKLMTLIHARDAYGRWLVGPDCFAAVYGAVGLQGA